MPITQQVIFFVPPQVHILDLTGPVQVFYEAAQYGAPYKLRYCSLQNQVTSSAGLPMGLVQHFTELLPQRGDLIFIPGMDIDYIRSHEFKAEHNFFAWLRESIVSVLYYALFARAHL